MDEGKEPDIHMMVLYTADIGQVKMSMERTTCRIQEAAYLVGMPSEVWLEDAKRGITAGEVTDEVLMHLVILPFDLQGKRKKQRAIKQYVDLVRQIPDKEQEGFVLAGILTFTDKVISEETKRYIKEGLGMTQVGKMLMDEGRKADRRDGNMNRAKKTALNMLKRGDSLNDVAEIFGASGRPH